MCVIWDSKKERKIYRHFHNIKIHKPLSKHIQLVHIVMKHGFKKKILNIWSTIKRSENNFQIIFIFLILTGL